MSSSYKSITRQIAQSIRLIMTDIDGTLTEGGDSLISQVDDAIVKLERKGILVGLVSGRTDSMLQKMAAQLNITGPLIAENGAIARINPSAPLLELGYSRLPANEALAKLYAAYPGQVSERWDNSERMVDIVFRAEGVPIEELRRLLPYVQVLDSHYIMHIMQKGINKGETLLNILPLVANGAIVKDQVMVAGDSATDLSLFEIFPVSVLIRNRRIPPEESRMLKKVAHYISDNEQGYGFAEVASHILGLLG